MTLSPVFRSESSVRLLEQEGIWARLSGALDDQVRAVRTVHSDLPGLLGEEFLVRGPFLPEAGETGSPAALSFLQEYFFLILFRGLFESLGVDRGRLGLYAEVNFCIKGTITAADNLFDGQAKSLLPIVADRGSRFLSILQLMCFERLIRRALDRGIASGVLDSAQADRVLRGLLDRMAGIGSLEGSEEDGVTEILAPEPMIERVHRVRGGLLFALAFVPPSVLEEGESAARFARAEPAVARLGTAFQIVDDLTDFEFDVGRRSHNLLVSWIHHRGSDEERRALSGLLDGRDPVSGGMVETVFGSSARAVLEVAYGEARASFEELAALGFWFPPHLADEVVRAIVGLEGVARMASLTAGEPGALGPSSD